MVVKQSNMSNFGASNLTLNSTRQTCIANSMIYFERQYLCIISSFSSIVVWYIRINAPAPQSLDGFCPGQANHLTLLHHLQTTAAPSLLCSPYNSIAFESSTSQRANQLLTCVYVISIAVPQAYQFYSSCKNSFWRYLPIQQYVSSFFVMAFVHTAICPPLFLIPFVNIVIYLAIFMHHLTPTKGLRRPYQFRQINYYFNRHYEDRFTQVTGDSSDEWINPRWLPNSFLEIRLKVIISA